MPSRSQPGNSLSPRGPGHGGARPRRPESGRGPLSVGRRRALIRPRSRRIFGHVLGPRLGAGQRVRAGTLGARTCCVRQRSGDLGDRAGAAVLLPRRHASGASLRRHRAGRRSRTNSRRPRMTRSGTSFSGSRSRTWGGRRMRCARESSGVALLPISQGRLLTAPTSSTSSCGSTCS